MKSTNFKTKFGISLLMAVCCSLMAFNVRAQVNTPTFQDSQEFKITTTLGESEANKSFIFTVPANVYSIQIECWGAGAAGSYMEAPGVGHDPRCGSGGGGGAYARLNSYAVTPGQQLTVYVGHGGSGAQNTRSGGGDSYVVSGTSVIVKAVGGAEVADNFRGGATKGGKAANCIGDVKFDGGNGGKGYKGYGGCSGAGGGAAGSAGFGSNGEDGGQYVSQGGAAGSGNPSNGKGANGVFSSTGGEAGATGTNYGAGGSGGSTSWVGDGRGGNGGDGIVIISYNNCASATAGTIATQSEGCVTRLVNVTSGTGNNYHYSWQKSANGTTGWTDVPNISTESYTPTEAGYYRRGCTATCGATAYTSAYNVAVEHDGAGYISVQGQPTVNTIEFCKNNLLDTNLQANIGAGDISASIPITWQYSVDNGNSWNDATPSMAANQPFNINMTLTQNAQYRYYYKPIPTCQVVCNGVVKVTVDTGVIYKSDFVLNNEQVNIVLPYGESTITPLVSVPSYNYVNEVTSITNNLTDTANNGTLFGTVGVGPHIIRWTVKDCAHPAGRVFEQVYNVSYPQCGGTFTAVDADGNQYQTVRVGTQCWMKQNLKVKHYADLTAVTQSGADTIMGTMAYNNEEANVATYGLLYSWYAAVGVPENSPIAPTLTEDAYIVGACPSGWHLPTNAQYQELLNANIDSQTPATIYPQAGLFNGVTESSEGLNTTSAFWSVDSNRPQGRSNFICNGNCDPLREASVNKVSAMSIRCIHN